MGTHSDPGSTAYWVFLWGLLLVLALPPLLLLALRNIL